MSSSINCIRYWRLFAFSFVKKIFCSNIFYFEINFTIIYDSCIIFLFLSLVLNNFTNCGREHSKLFTNCHVSWDTLQVIFLNIFNFIYLSHLKSEMKISNTELWCHRYPILFKTEKNTFSNNFWETVRK